MDERERDEALPAEGAESTQPAAGAPPAHAEPASEAPPAHAEPALEAAPAHPEPPAPATSEPAPAAEEAPDPAPEPAPLPAPPPRKPGRFDVLAEPAEVPVPVPARHLASQSRRSFLLFAGGLVATAAGAWWLLPDDTRARLFPGAGRHRLDTLEARVGLTRERRERAMQEVLGFDDDVAEALYSKTRRVRTYRRDEVTALPNNYAGDTPDPDYIATWALNLKGLASGRVERLSAPQLTGGRFEMREEVTRLVCVEGWSAVAWWGGIRFADFLEAYPPAAGARWAALRSSVNLDDDGNPDPYYVSLDLETARHPQSLLATHQGGRPLTVEHGAPLRLLVPMKLGLKNIKAITDIEYTAAEPPDYWNQRGYSKYDGI